MDQLAARISGPVAVIGDVHGQTDKLVELLDALRVQNDFSKRWIVFIGDFVDRGSDPAGTLETICDLLAEHPRTTGIAGNHDFAMASALGWIPVPEYSNWDERWIDHYDSGTTFESYGVEPGEIEELSARIPQPHREFLAGLPWVVEHPSYLFVHAGLDPNSPFDMQLRILREKDFTLNRPPWLCSRSLVDADVPDDCPLTVVSGHVAVPKVVFRKKRILIDTTGGIEGPLSCVLLPEKKVIASEGASGGRSSRQSWWRALTG